MKVSEVIDKNVNEALEIYKFSRKRGEKDPLNWALTQLMLEKYIIEASIEKTKLKLE